MTRLLEVGRFEFWLLKTLPLALLAHHNNVVHYTVVTDYHKHNHYFK
jgi:hypothetical protein